jgi:hypothetical protein
MKNFINGIIESKEFSHNIFGLYKKNFNAYDEFKVDFENLEDFQPHFRSKGFNRNER